MHNCQNTKEELFDLLFGETDRAQTQRLRGEILFCAGCRSEYRRFQETFDEYEKFCRLDVPEENYWRGYEMRLGDMLMAVETTQPKKMSGANLIRNFLSARIRVPVPVAAAFILFLAGAAFFAVRFSAIPVQTNEIAAEPQIVPVEVEKIIVREKEVWRDRVVTQKIYVPQRESRYKNTVALTARQKQKTEITETNMPLLNLAEFQPPAKVEPKIIAEGAYGGK